VSVAAEIVLVENDENGGGVGSGNHDTGA